MSQEAIRLALNKAFQLGQRYWSWADSEYSSHWKKADAAKAEFDQLVQDTINAALAEQPAQQEPVAAECNFFGTKEWGRCSIEHHNLVQSEPHNWPDYQTRLLYTFPQPSKPCAWQREDDDHMPDTWCSDCGVLWTFSDGSPVDNEMKYCCGCGAILLEKKT